MTDCDLKSISSQLKSVCPPDYKPCEEEQNSKLKKAVHSSCPASWPNDYLKCCKKTANDNNIIGKCILSKNPSNPYLKCADIVANLTDKMSYPYRLNSQSGGHDSHHGDNPGNNPWDNPGDNTRDNSKKKLSTGAIIGIVLGSIVGIVLLILIFLYLRKK